MKKYVGTLNDRRGLGRNLGDIWEEQKDGTFLCTFGSMLNKKSDPGAIHHDLILGYLKEYIK